MNELNRTQYFRVQKDTEPVVKDVIDSVYAALTEQGYNPVNHLILISALLKANLFVCA